MQAFGGIAGLIDRVTRFGKPLDDECGDGLLIFDTCPSEEAFRAFFGSADVQALFAEVGLVDGVAEDYPVVRAYAQHAEIDSTAWDGS